MKRLVIIAAVLLLIVATVHAAFETYREAMDAGHKSFLADHLDEAEVQFKEAGVLAQNEKEKASATLSLAQVYITAGNYEAMLSILPPLLEAAGTPSATTAPADATKADATKTEAASTRIPPADIATARLYTGMAHAELKYPAKAKELLLPVVDDAAATDSTRVLSQFLLATVYQNERGYEKARELFATVVANEKAEIGMRVDAQRAIGATYKAEGKSMQALVEYTKALDLASDSMAAKEAAPGNSDEAKRAKDDARAPGQDDSAAAPDRDEPAAPTKDDSASDPLSKSDPLTKEQIAAQMQMLQRGTDLVRAGQYDKAAESFAEILAFEISPTLVRYLAWGHLGATYLLQKKPVLARRELEPLIKNLGRELLLRTDLAENEIAILQRVRQIAQLDHALTYEMENNKPQMREELQKLLAQPNLTPSVQKLAQEELEKLP